jgi:hypothetical protein
MAGKNRYVDYLLRRPFKNQRGENFGRVKIGGKQTERPAD